MRSAEWDTTSVLVRAFCVLDAFVPEGGEMGLSELVRRTGLPKATVHRLATQLVDIGALEKMGDRYRPGLRLFELGSVVVRHRRLRDSALPLMEDLYEATHETVHLGIPDGLDVLYLEKIVGPRGSPVSTRVGTRKPLYCTALGKAMLAFSPGELLRAVLAGGLTAHAPRTIVLPDLLMAELEKARQNGLAYDFEEYVPGTSCVASPILDRNRLAIAALSVTGPVTRFDPERYAPAVRTAALTLSRTLSGARLGP